MTAGDNQLSNPKVRVPMRVERGYREGGMLKFDILRRLFLRRRNNLSARGGSGATTVIGPVREGGLDKLGSCVEDFRGGILRKITGFLYWCLRCEGNVTSLPQASTVDRVTIFAKARRRRGS